MGYLVGVTALWAFSFSLIGVYLAGQVDSYFAVLVRVTLAMLVFLPFLRPSLLRGKQRLALMALGAIQLGIMYTFFYHSFLLLSVPEVLLFTIFTPVYIALLDDLMFKRFTPIYLVTAILAVLGAGVIRYDGIDSGFWLGFLVVQGANLCFAIGQVGYRRLAADLPPTLAWHNLFGWFFRALFRADAAGFAWSSISSSTIAAASLPHWCSLCSSRSSTGSAAAGSPSFATARAAAHQINRRGK